MGTAESKIISKSYQFENKGYQTPQKPMVIDEQPPQNELNQCFSFVASNATLINAISVNASFVVSSQLSLNHPYRDPDISAWVRDESHRNQNMNFQELRRNQRFIQNNGKQGVPLKEVSIAMLVKQYGIQKNESLENLREASLSLNSKQSYRTVEPRQKIKSKMQQMQGNENFTDIDDYLQIMESDFTPRQRGLSQLTSSQDREFSNKFRKQESIQYVSNSQTTSVRSLPKSHFIKPTQYVNLSVDTSNNKKRQQIAQVNYDTEDDLMEAKDTSQNSIKPQPFFSYKMASNAQKPISKSKVTQITQNKKTSNVKFYGSLKQQVEQQQEQPKLVPVKIDYPIKTTTQKYLEPPQSFQRIPKMDKQQPPTITLQVPQNKQKVNLQIYDSFANQQKQIDQSHYQAQMTQKQKQRNNTQDKPNGQMKEDKLIGQPTSQNKLQPQKPKVVQERNNLNHELPPKYVQNHTNETKTPIQQNYQRYEPDQQSDYPPELSSLRDSRRNHQRDNLHDRKESINKLQNKIDQILLDKDQNGDQKEFTFKKIEPDNHKYEALMDIKGDIDKLTNRMNLNISPSYVKGGQKVNSSSQISQHGETVQSFGFDDLPDYSQPVIIEFSWEQFQNYQKK